MKNKFNALILRQEDEKTVAEIQGLSNDDLPGRDLLVRVRYSSLNYKDALAVTGKGKVIRNFPIVPGIDLAGEVVDPGQSDYQPGDLVICTGWGVGEQYWGGLAQYARLDPSWVLPLPAQMDLRKAMIMGTAGLTAGLCALAITDHGVKPGDGPVLVTGAGGGVGGVSTMLLNKLGYEVHAVSGREELNEYLEKIGATGMLPRNEFERESRPLERAIWSAGVDTVGGGILATLLSQIKDEGIVAACGNAAGIDLHTTVFPFILRGVTLRGISSVMAATERRRRAWQLLAGNITDDFYTLLLNREITLEEVPLACEQLIAGKVRGRIIVSLQ
jgi:acrylyl-CoA reductase (NADPH)